MAKRSLRVPTSVLLDSKALPEEARRVVTRELALGAAWRADAIARIASRSMNASLRSLAGEALALRGLACGVLAALEQDRLPTCKLSAMLANFTDLSNLAAATTLVTFQQCITSQAGVPLLLPIAAGVDERRDRFDVIKSACEVFALATMSTEEVASGAISEPPSAAQMAIHVLNDSIASARVCGRTCELLVWSSVVRDLFRDAGALSSGSRSASVQHVASAHAAAPRPALLANASSDGCVALSSVDAVAIDASLERSNHRLSPIDDEQSHDMRYPSALRTSASRGFVPSHSPISMNSRPRTSEEATTISDDLADAIPDRQHSRRAGRAEQEVESASLIRSAASSQLCGSPREGHRPDQRRGDCEDQADELQLVLPSRKRALHVDLIDAVDIDDIDVSESSDVAPCSPNAQQSSMPDDEALSPSSRPLRPLGQSGEPPTFESSVQMFEAGYRERSLVRAFAVARECDALLGGAGNAEVRMVDLKQTLLERGMLDDEEMPAFLSAYLATMRYNCRERRGTPPICDGDDNAVPMPQFVQIIGLRAYDPTLRTWRGKGVRSAIAMDPKHVVAFPMLVCAHLCHAAPDAETFARRFPWISRRFISLTPPRELLVHMALLGERDDEFGGALWAFLAPEFEARHAGANTALAWFIVCALTSAAHDLFGLTRDYRCKQVTYNCLKALLELALRALQSPRIAHWFAPAADDESEGSLATAAHEEQREARARLRTAATHTIARLVSRAPIELDPGAPSADAASREPLSCSRLVDALAAAGLWDAFHQMSLIDSVARGEDAGALRNPASLVKVEVAGRSHSSATRVLRSDARLRAQAASTVARTPSPPDDREALRRRVAVRRASPPSELIESDASDHNNENDGGGVRGRARGRGEPAQKRARV